MKRACGCRVYRLWRLVLTIDCGLFWVCLRGRGGMLKEHEDWMHSLGKNSLRRRAEDAK